MKKRNHFLSGTAVFFISLLIVGCSTAGETYDNPVGDVIDQAANVVQSVDENVIMVKNGSPYSHPNTTYDEAFGSFFGSPAWKYFKGTSEGPDEDGDGKPDTVEENLDVVEFTGYCMYSDVKVKALIQFVLDKEAGTFESRYLSFNDVPQNQLLLSTLIEKAFSSYEEANGTSETDADNINSYDETVASDAETTQIPTETENYAIPETLADIGETDALTGQWFSSDKEIEVDVVKNGNTYMFTMYRYDTDVERIIQSEVEDDLLFYYDCYESPMNKKQYSYAESEGLFFRCLADTLESNIDNAIKQNCYYNTFAKEWNHDEHDPYSEDGAYLFWVYTDPDSSWLDDDNNTDTSLDVQGRNLQVTANGLIADDILNYFNSEVDVYIGPYDEYNYDPYTGVMTVPEYFLEGNIPTETVLIADWLYEKTSQRWSSEFISTIEDTYSCHSSSMPSAIGSGLKGEFSSIYLRYYTLKGTPKSEYVGLDSDFYDEGQYIITGVHDLLRKMKSGQ